MNTRNKVLLGIIGAAAAGVVVGLLIAPDKGKDTRKKLKKTAGDWADTVSSLWAKGRRAADDFVEDGKEKIKHAKSSADKMKESYS